MLAALGPVVIGTAIPAREPHRPGGQVAQLLYRLDQGVVEIGLAAAEVAAKLVLREIAAQITLNKLVRTASGSAAWDVRGPSN